MSSKLYTLDNTFIDNALQTPPKFTGIVENTFGSRFWFLNGVLHREDGPAHINFNNTNHWYFGGKTHRIDGPAVEWFNGEKEWWVDGNQITEEQCKLLYDLMKLKGLL